MGDVNWSIITGAPNPGVAFANAFQNGLQQRQQDALQQQQMQEHEQDRQIKLQQLQQAQAQQLIDQHRDNIIKGAQVIRQLQPKDDASWQQALSVAAQAGVDVSQVPPHYDPQYVQGIMAIADSFDPQKPQGTALQQNYQFLQGVDPHLAQHYLQNQAEGPPMIASNGDGTFTIIPRNMVGGGQSAPSAAPPAAVAYLKAHPEMRAQFDEKYGQGAADQALGGTGGNVGGGFPQ